MNKQKTNRAATAAIANRNHSELAAWRDRNAGIKEIAEYYPEAACAVLEYAQEYLAHEPLEHAASKHKRMWDLAGEIGNAFAQAMPGTTYQPFAQSAIAAYTAEGDMNPCYAVPASVVMGLKLLKAKDPALFSALVKFDHGHGLALVLDGTDRAASAVLMRSALAAA